MPTSSVSTVYKRFELSLIVIVALLFLFGLCVAFQPPFYGQRFDPQVWLRANGGDCIRGPMVDDIVRNRLVKGVTKKSEVLRTLGADGGGQAREQQYILGMCSGFGFDYDMLHLYFDENDLFSGAEVRQH
jgi:hypothetical protein